MKTLGKIVAAAVVATTLTVGPYLVHKKYQALQEPVAQQVQVEEQHDRLYQIEQQCKDYQFELAKPYVPTQGHIDMELVDYMRGEREELNDDLKRMLFTFLYVNGELNGITLDDQLKRMDTNDDHVIDETEAHNYCR